MFRMFVDALEGFPTAGALVALVLFVAVFVGVVAWVYRRSGRRHYEYMSRLPLDRRNSE
jgi:cbb3-type cytochrome oxidase subunit 3